MAYFRSIPKIQTMLDLMSRDDRWLIVINADPDAMASAMALRRIMRHRVQESAIARVNEVKRPDNLAMVRYARMHMERLSPELLEKYNRFAMVDSQPHHHPEFQGIDFSIIIDHHPLPEVPYEAAYTEVRPEYGSNSTLLTEYLYNLNIRPGKLLATALQFGIKTDTASFERHFYDVDLRAYQYLARFGDHAMLSRIARSEFHRHWLEVLARACTNMYSIKSGEYTFVGEVDNPDALVLVADFFMRVYEIRWVAVGGTYKGIAVIVFRGDGIARDVGQLASQTVCGIGSGGGHKAMARAEFSVEAAQGKDLELFIWHHLKESLGVMRKIKVKCDEDDNRPSPDPTNDLQE